MGTATEETLRWDLTRLYQGPADPQLQVDLDEARRQATSLRDRYLGRLAGLAPADLLVALRDKETFDDLVTKLLTYAALAFWSDTRDEALKAMHNRVNGEVTGSQNEAKFFEVELQTAPADRLEVFHQAPELAPYRYFLERAKRQAPYTLGEPEERVLGIKDTTGLQAWLQLYTEITASIKVELDLPGGRQTLSAPEAKGLRNDADRTTRAIATGGLLGAYQAQSHVLTYLFNTVYEDYKQTDQLRGFTDPMASTLIAEDIDRAVIEALLGAVEEHYHVAHRYYRIKARALGLSDLGSHDLYAPYPAGGRDVPFETGRAIVLDAYGSLSPQVAELARGFFEERYIDVPPRAGKQGGAFCARMVPKMHPYVLLNYTNHMADVGTLAHELGHGVHFMIAGERQTSFNYYPIPPLAETASVFMELLTVNRLLATETDPRARQQLLASRIEYAIFIIMLQVVNTRFEQRGHALRREGQVTADAFCAIWAEETAKLYGPDVAMHPLERWRWLTVPHLVQFRYYSYSYAFAQLLVFALYKLYEEQGEAFVPQFMEVLAAGSSAPPAEILARVGVDIKDPAFWQKGLKLLEAMVDEFEATVDNA